MSEEKTWVPVHYPIESGDHIPAERKVVLVWVRGNHLPWCGYIRYAAGDRDCPFFVVYHRNDRVGGEVLAWCDCLPGAGPAVAEARMYSQDQRTGRGFPERIPEPQPITPEGGEA